jgi:hypothetical protein
MKIITEPKEGKLGTVVYQGGRYGQIVRALVIPTNPRSSAQRAVRARLVTTVRGWAGLTQLQRDAWTAAAVALQSVPRLGLSGKLTGNQLYTKVNCNLLIIGGDPVSAPPTIPTFQPLPITGLQITNVSNVIALKLVKTGSPPDGTMLRGAPPCSAGRYRSPNAVVLGTLSTPVGNAIDITSAYTGRFGVPPVGAKVFTFVNQNVDGFADLPIEFSAVVPASS